MLSSVVNGLGSFILGMAKLVKRITYPIIKIVAIIIIASFVISWLAMVVVGHVATPFIPVISPDPVISGYLGFYSGIIALGIIPLVVLVWMLFRVGWGHKVSKGVRRAVFGVWVVTFIVFLSTVFFTAKNFTQDYSDSEVLYEQSFNSEDELNFNFSDSYRDVMSDHSSIINFDHSFIAGNRLYVKDVTLQLLPTDSDQLKVVRTIRSAGANRRSARSNMKYPRHDFDLTENTIKVTDYYSINRKEKYRAQCLQYVVHIPVGTKINFNERSWLLHHADFSDRFKIDTEQIYVMTEEGISPVTEEGISPEETES